MNDKPKADMLICWLRYWWEYGDEKTRINKLNEMRSLIPWGLRVPFGR